MKEQAAKTLLLLQCPERSAAMPVVKRNVWSRCHVNGDRQPHGRTRAFQACFEQTGPQGKTA